MPFVITGAHKKVASRNFLSLDIIDNEKINVGKNG